MDIRSNEYIDRETETPFETFLRHTDEKTVSAKTLSDILKETITPEAPTHLFDIGAGTGEYISRALNLLPRNFITTLTLLEPSAALFEELRKTVSSFPVKNVETIDISFETFETDERYDIILASHLYHIGRERMSAEYGKMINLLASKGYLIVVLRTKDDVYEFKNQFKPLLHDYFTEALTIGDVKKALSNINPNGKLVFKEAFADSKIEFPMDRQREIEMLVDFFLNREWRDIDPSTQNDILNYLKNKGGVLQQQDCLLIISHTNA